MHWDWFVFWTTLRDFQFAEAAWTTVWAAVIAEAAGVIVGLAAALIWLSRFAWLRRTSELYVWAWRGSPLLVQLLLLYFGLPQVGIRLSVIAAGLLGLVLNEGAYMSVIIRTGLQAVDRGQRDAARALGLTSAQSLWLVELPQAARAIVPALGNQFNSMMKTTALLSVISFSELLRYTEQVVSDTYRPLEAFAVASLYYLVLSSVWNLIQAGIEHKLGAGTGASGHRLRRLSFDRLGLRETPTT